MFEEVLANKSLKDKADTKNPNGPLTFTGLTAGKMFCGRSRWEVGSLDGASKEELWTEQSGFDGDNDGLPAPGETGLGDDVDVESLQRRILEWTKWLPLPSLGILFMESEKAETLISIKPR